MICDICGATVNKLSYECSTCGHGICSDCEIEIKERSMYLPNCFWWSCSEYHKIEIESELLSTLDISAQRFGALSGWTAELAEDSIIPHAENVIQDVARQIAQEEVDYNEPLIPTPLADNIVERVRWNNQLRELIIPARQTGRTQAREAENVAALVRTGAITPNEARERIGLDPISFEREYGSEPVIGDRRRISFTRPSRFDRDMDEIRVTERIAFPPTTNNSISHITGVNDIGEF